VKRFVCLVCFLDFLACVVCFSLENLRVEYVSMASVPGTTNEGTPFLGLPFVSPSVGHVGPPYISTLTLPKLTIELPIWFFSTPVNVNPPSASSIITPPQDHQPFVYPLPSSPVGSSSRPSSLPSEIFATSNHVDKKKKKRKIKKKKNKIGGEISNHCRICWKKSTNYCLSCWEC
jgi:hypothetical protein